MTQDNNTQLNDVKGPVISGTVTGDIHVASGPEADELAKELIAKYGPVRAEMAVVMGTQSRVVEVEKAVKQYFLSNDLDRVWRQRETDIHRQEIANQLKAINESLIALQPRLTRTETSAWRALLGSMMSLVLVVAFLVRGRR